MNYFFAGFCLAANHVLAAFGSRFGRIVPQYEITLPPEKHRGALLLFLLVCAALLTALVALLHRRGCKIPLLALWFAAVGMFGLLGMPSAVFFLPLAGVAALLLLYDRKMPPCTELLGKGMILLLVILLSLSAFLPVFPRESADAELLQLQKSLRKQLDFLRCGGRDEALPGGDFADLGSFEKNEKNIRLEVAMRQPQSMYLRGFVGSVYNGQGWEELPAQEKYESAQLFRSLHAQGFYGQTQLAAAAAAAGVNPKNANKITVNNIAASRKYAYAPYELCGDGELAAENGIGDAALHTSGLRGETLYSYTVLPNQVKRCPEIAWALHQSETAFSALERHYSRFAAKSYTAVPKRTRALLQTHLGVYDAAAQGILPQQEAKQRILSCLADSVHYDETAQTLLPQEDFLQVFLEKSGQGYAVHYASAAVLMLRYFGIPARYVEGYLVTPQDVEGKPANTLFRLADSHAHAWAEFYQDGVGWIPLETAPPYYDIMEKADALGGYPRGQDVSAAQPQEGAQADTPQEQGNRLSRRMALPKKLLTGLFAVGAVLLLFTAALAAVPLTKRRIVLRKRLRAIQTQNNRRAVLAAFAYTRQLLGFLGMPEENVSPLAREAEWCRFSGGTAAQVNAVLWGYTQAMFSEQNITDEQAEQARAFQHQVLVQLKAVLPRKQRLRLKIKGTY